MINPDLHGYVPEGDRCRLCVNHENDCNAMDFSSMERVGIGCDGKTRVRCAAFFPARKKDATELGYLRLGQVFAVGGMGVSDFMEIVEYLPGLIPDSAAVRKAIYTTGPIKADAVVRMIERQNLPYAPQDSPWNQHFVAYARAHGKGPDEMMAADKQTYPGGCMAGFLIWINRSRVAFRLANPEAFVGDHISDQDAWTAFLDERADAEALDLANLEDMAGAEREIHMIAGKINRPDREPYFDLQFDEAATIAFACGSRITGSDGTKYDSPPAPCRSYMRGSPQHCLEDREGENVVCSKCHLCWNGDMLVY